MINIKGSMITNIMALKIPLMNIKVRGNKNFSLNIYLFKTSSKETILNFKDRDIKQGQFLKSLLSIVINNERKLLLKENQMKLTTQFLRFLLF